MVPFLKYILFGALIAACVSCTPKWAKTQHLNHADAGFKYKVRVEKSQSLRRDRQKEWRTMNLGFESFGIERAEAFSSLTDDVDLGISEMINRNPMTMYSEFASDLNTYGELAAGEDADAKVEAEIARGTVNRQNPLSVVMERFILISDAYTYIDEERTKVDKVETPPLFKGGDEAKFAKWVVKKNTFRIPTEIKLNSACKGHVILDVTIDKEGYLSKIVPVAINDPFFDGEIMKSFVETLSSSPRWTPARENGVSVDSKYLIAMVWGHYRSINEDSPIYQEALERGYDPLDVFLPEMEWKD